MLSEAEDVKLREVVGAALKKYGRPKTTYPPICDFSHREGDIPAFAYVVEDGTLRSYTYKQIGMVEGETVQGIFQREGTEDKLVAIYYRKRLYYLF
jgi:hypothetical protein